MRTWFNPRQGTLKRQLSGHDRPELLGLVQDHYRGSKDNQAFLHARFNLGNDVLEPYKASIDRWVCPDVIHDQDISVRKASGPLAFTRSWLVTVAIFFGR